MKEVIIFGVEDFASLAHFYLNEDSDFKVAAFSVSGEYMPESGEFEGLPVIPFEDVEKTHSPDAYSFFAPMSHRGMNSLRAEILEKVRSKGYETISYVSSKLTMFSNVKIGTNCFILEDNTIQPFVEIADNVVLWSGNHIGHHSRIEENAFLTSHVVVSGHCTIGKNTFIGVNATLKDGLTIGEGTFIAMGASITRDTDEYSLYKGTPAKKSDIDSRRVC